MTEDTTVAGSTRDVVPRWLLGSLFAVSVWLLLPPLFGPEVNTTTVTEVVDHGIPAVAVLGAIALWAWRPDNTGSARLLVLAAILAFGTHVPLVLQAARGGVAWSSAIWHTAPTFVLAVLAVTALLHTLGGSAPPAERN